MSENPIIGAPTAIGAPMMVDDGEAWEDLAPSTRRNYRAAFSRLQSWTAEHGAGARSGVDLLRRFMEAEARAGRVAGLHIVLAALTCWQRYHGQQVTADDPRIRKKMRRLRREARPPRQAAALGDSELEQIRATALQPRRGRLGRWEERVEVQLRAQVDVALCQLASDAGLRRSEASRLTWDDYEEWPDGSGRLRIAPSKGATDEQVVYVTPAAAWALRDLRMMQGVLDSGAGGTVLDEGRKDLQGVQRESATALRGGQGQG